MSIDATDVTWEEKSRTVKLWKNWQEVGRLNMDNIVGWVYIDAVPKGDFYELESGEERPIK